MTAYISYAELPPANPLTGAEILAVSQTGTSVQTTLTDVLAILAASSLTWTPVITSGTGTLTATATNIAVYYAIGNLVYFTLQVVTTTNGTGATNIAITLPIAPSVNPFFVSGFATTSGKLLTGNYLGSGSTISITNYDGTYPASNGETISISGWYES